MLKQNSNTITVTPHLGQVPILLSKKKLTVAIAGIQGGKTFSGCLWVQLEIQKNPDKNHLVCALSHDQLQNSVITKFFEMFPGYQQYYVKKEKTIYLPTGGHVFFRPLEDPKYTEGITAHSAWIDEADLCGYRAYLVVRGRLGATNGRMLLTSSLADSGWLAVNILKWQEQGDKDFELCTWKSKDNPSFSREEWDSLKAELDPIIFRRRYEAEFSFASGRIYDRFNDDLIVTKFKYDDEVVKHTFMGFDWGYEDPTAIVIVQVTNRDNVYIREDFSVQKASFSLIELVVGKFKHRYVKIRASYADPSNKMVLEEMKKRLHMEIQPGYRDIFFGTSKIRNLIFQGRFFVFKDAVNTLQEIKRYMYKESLAGYTEEPASGFDHCMDAMRYVIATYPIKDKSIERHKAELVEQPAFWMRRTKLYKAEYKRHNGGEELWTP